MATSTSKRRCLIMGAAGRDFHNFNMVLRDNPAYDVVAFTATQIPGISDRRYPAALAGPAYPGGIPILEDGRLEEICREEEIQEVMFAYSDVPHATVMHAASRALSHDADFVLLGPRRTMIQSARPVIAVSAALTGCGKSQTARWLSKRLRGQGLRAAVIRHPMPYGDLARQAVQRFATREDLDLADCTIEEREEYEPHIAAGGIVFAGADYVRVLSEAEKEADIILWDGGNNDTPFYAPNLLVTLVDPHRPGHELSHYPGRENLEMADIVLFNKMDSADKANVAIIEKNVKELNPNATLVYAGSPIHVDQPQAIAGKRVVVVEDGPTLTHGGMKFGAGILAAKAHGAAEIVDPRPYLVGSIAETFEKYPDIGMLIPAMGYGDKQVKDLEETLRRVDCDTVIIGTPIDLGRVLKIDKPSVRVTYELDDTLSKPSLGDLVRKHMA